MVFDGPWRRRRQYPNGPPPGGYGPYGATGYPPGYDPRYRQLPRGYRYRQLPRGYRSRGGFGGGQGSCLRDRLFLDAGCCLAESFGCGPNLLLVAPSAVRLGDGSVGRDLRARLLALIAEYQREIGTAPTRAVPLLPHLLALRRRRDADARPVVRAMADCPPAAALPSRGGRWTRSGTAGASGSLEQVVDDLLAEAEAGAHGQRLTETAAVAAAVAVVAVRRLVGGTVVGELPACCSSRSYSRSTSPASGSCSDLVRAPEFQAREPGNRRTGRGNPAP